MEILMYDGSIMWVAGNGVDFSVYEGVPYVHFYEDERMKALIPAKHIEKVYFNDEVIFEKKVIRYEKK